MGNPDSDTTNQNVDPNEQIKKNPLPRESLINTAVTFLSDKKIVNQDPTLLRQFLLKKGLTDEEASIAFQRLANFKKEQNLVAEYGQPPPLPPQFSPSPYPLPLPPPVPSVWHTVHNIITTITSIGGIFYAIYWLWKTYISPYLFGRKPKKKSLETSLGELEAAVEGCVNEIRTIRSSVDNLAGQRAAELANAVVVSRVQEVKTEISSLKALLLNRNQFPATPAPLTGSISIPAWQMSASETTHAEREGEGEEEEGGSNGGTNGSDSSLEIVKDPNQ